MSRRYPTSKKISIQKFLAGFKSLSLFDSISVGIAVAFSVWILMFVYVANKVFDTFGEVPQVQEARSPCGMDETAQRFEETWESIGRSLSKSMSDSEARAEQLSRERQALFQRLSDGIARTQAALERKVRRSRSKPLEPIKMRHLSPVQVEWIPQESGTQPAGRSEGQQTLSVPDQKSANMGTANTQNNSNR